MQPSQTQYRLSDRLTRELASKAVPHPAGKVLISQGKRLSSPALILRGWASEETVLPDGRRQILVLHLPGDIIGFRSRLQQRAMTSTVSLTPIEIAHLNLDYGRLGLVDQEDIATYCRGQEDARDRRLIEQIVRLGLLTAQERLAALLLDLHDRLAEKGEAADGKFILPLKQEILGAVLGISAVHVNRSIRHLRRQNIVRTRGLQVEILDMTALDALAGKREAY